MAPAPDPAVPRSAGLTYADYLELPDNEGTRCEILDGDLAVTPSPRTRHQRVSRNLHRILDRHVMRHDLGELFYAPTDVILADTSIVVPDLLFVRKERGRVIVERAIEGPPDLIVEILSPSTSKCDRETKRKLYERYGVRCYWIVDPDARRVVTRELEAGRYRIAADRTDDAILQSSPFPDLAIPLGEVWP